MFLSTALDPMHKTSLLLFYWLEYVHKQKSCCVNRINFENIYLQSNTCIWVKNLSEKHTTNSSIVQPWTQYTEKAIHIYSILTQHLDLFNLSTINHHLQNKYIKIYYAYSHLELERSEVKLVQFSVSTSVENLPLLVFLAKNISSIFYLLFGSCI